MSDLDFVVRESNRCLLCFEPPCNTKCFSGINPKRFIRKIKWNDIDGAIRHLRDENPLYGTCAYLCPKEGMCMTACTSSNLDRPIDIPRLQKFVFGEEVKRNNRIIKKIKFKSKKVAIIGSGPAGLSTAAYLTRFGIRPTIYEEKALPAFMLQKIIPDFRLPRNVIKYEIEFIKSLGVEIKTNQKIDDLNELKKSYDAVVLANGMWKESGFNLKSEVDDGIYTSLDFLEKYNSNQLNDLGENVIVVGGGDTAMDIARCALKKNAKATVVYRRPRNSMPCHYEEFDLAICEGVDFIFSTILIEVIGKKKIEAVKCTRGEWVKSKNGLEYKPVGTEFEMPASSIILATGQQLKNDYGLNKAANKNIKIEFSNMMTTIEGVFACGDVVGGNTVVEAVGMGKKVAISINNYLETCNG